MRDKSAVGIYLRGSVYWLNYQRNGKRIFVSLETSDYEEARTNAIAIRTAPALNPGSTFDAEIDAFLAYKRRKNEFTASSAHGRKFILKAFARYVGLISAANVTTAGVQAFYDTKQSEHSISTANTYARILSSFFNWCVDVSRICRRNPCDGLDMSEEMGTRMRDFCTNEQRDKLIRECKKSDDLLFVLFCGFHAGLRKNEIIEARPFWFDLNAGLLHLRKTSTMNFKDREERTIPLTAEFLAFLKVYGLREPFMLKPEVKHGRNRYRYDFTRPFKKYAKEQELEWVTPHTMRHTFASLLSSAGVSLFKISVWLGDDPRVVDRRYARLKPKDPDIERSHSGYSPAAKRSQHKSR